MFNTIKNKMFIMFFKMISDVESGPFERFEIFSKIQTYSINHFRQ